MNLFGQGEMVGCYEYGYELPEFLNTENVLTDSRLLSFSSMTQL
jgi:hypothetical protein